MRSELFFEPKAEGVTPEEALRVFEQAQDLVNQSIQQIALRITGNLESAEEVAQDAFFTLYTGVLEGRVRGNVLPWLATVARNAALMRLRDLAGFKGMLPLSEHPAGKGDVGETLAVREMLRTAIAELPKQQQAAVSMKLLENCAYVEIAQELNCNLQTARNHFNLGLATLRKELRRRMEE